MVTQTNTTTTFLCTGCNYSTSEAYTIEVINSITEFCPECEQVVFEDEFHTA